MQSASDGLAIGAVDAGCPVVRPLWGGRFESVPSVELASFGASIAVDQRLWREDIRGSVAHARMLATVGVISEADFTAIEAGLAGIGEEIEAGSFVFGLADEDIHMAIERSLCERIGAAGKRLHTGRSRNDQVALDIRLYLKSRTVDLMEGLVALQRVIVRLAEEHLGVIMPGYTHLQKAQPVLFSHHLLAYFWMFDRDVRRLRAAWSAANVCPLGAAALAGTSYPLDRRQTARELGFVDVAGQALVVPNSMDAVSDRDFILDAVYASSTVMMHLSRLCEELILWSSFEFGFISLSDDYATGSSIMPQKKNPDFAELIRGKTGRVYGDLTALLTLLKGLPLAYNKDMQEDKQAVFDALDTVELSLRTMTGMLAHTTVNEAAMSAGAEGGFMAATDLADWLVARGMPFREAHHVVGQLVLLAAKSDRTLADLSLDEMRAVCSLFDEQALAALDIEQVVAARSTEGGTSCERVSEQLQQARVILAKAPSNSNLPEPVRHD